VAEDFVYVVLHKPRNVVSTLSDPEGRPTVADHLRPLGSRLFPVGRLDFATSGVLLATNDGEFSNAMLHPKGGVPKTYVVKVRGIMDADDIRRWEQGVELEDGRTLPAQVSIIRHEEDRTWFEITIREGRNQQIRRMGEATGFLVMRLARTSFAGVTHEGLRPGQARMLNWQELSLLKETYGVPKKVPRMQELPARPQRLPRPVRVSDAKRPPRPVAQPDERSDTAPPRERSDRTAPPRERSDRTVPPRERSDRTAPSRERSDRTAPSRERSDRTAPSRERSDRTAPPRERSDRTAPPRERSDRTAPSRERSDRTAPPRERSDRTAPPRERSDRTAPSRERSDRTAPPRERSDRTAPSRERSDRATGAAKQPARPRRAATRK
jgi:23S rRNA pseudouridine2605 synthase